MVVLWERAVCYLDGAEGRARRKPVRPRHLMLAHASEPAPFSENATIRGRDWYAPVLTLDVTVPEPHGSWTLQARRARDGTEGRARREPVRPLPARWNFQVASSQRAPIVEHR